MVANEEIESNFELPVEEKLLPGNKGKYLIWEQWRRI